jgi:hypothetical protein
MICNLAQRFEAVSLAFSGLRAKTMRRENHHEKQETWNARGDIVMPRRHWRDNTSITEVWVKSTKSSG